jgi:hypothetical protein
MATSFSSGGCLTIAYRDKCPVSLCVFVRRFTRRAAAEALLQPRRRPSNHRKPAAGASKQTVIKTMLTPSRLSHVTLLPFAPPKKTSPVASCEMVLSRKVDITLR